MILIIEANMRPGGNGAALAAVVTKKYTGKPFEHFQLRDNVFSGCINCRACKENNSFCAIEDDLKPIWSKMAEASLIVVISPNMFGFICGELKELMDRVFCMRSADQSSKFKPLAKVVHIITQSSPDKENSSKAHDWFRNFVSLYGIKYLGITVPSCSNENNNAINAVVDDMLLTLTFFE